MAVLLFLVVVKESESVFGKLKSLFSKTEPSRVEELKSCIDDILKMQEADLTDNKEKLSHCLELMEKEVKRVKAQSNGYPNSTIAGDVWFDGAALANLGEALAYFLSDKDFLEEQSKATNLWTGAVLSVCSHYHHMVGPAMIANASINEKTGNIEYSKTAYSAVLQDFECILEYSEEDDFKPEGDDEVALQSLQTACNRLVELDELSGVNSKAPELLKRIRAVMKKPIAPDEENN
ncbi:hypothetical protein [Aliikangiella sp. IMCC44359]|uniref:hypothetical protein n=1 Tax=Aliikangiella sp. IMCC44359 TaxID=3459125 RepID=UPI00403A8711